MCVLRELREGVSVREADFPGEITIGGIFKVGGFLRRFRRPPFSMG